MNKQLKLEIRNCIEITRIFKLETRKRAKDEREREKGETKSVEVQMRRFCEVIWTKIMGLPLPAEQ
jgi:hypothetical protein